MRDLPFHVAGHYPKPALVGRCTPDGINVASSREFFEQIRDFSLGLKGIGVGPGSRVALICETRPEWMVADLGVLTAGAVTVPIYPTLPADRVRYILADAGVSAVVASDEEQAAKVGSVRSLLPELETVVVIDSESGGSEAGAGSGDVSFAEVCQQGHRRLDAGRRSRARIQGGRSGDPGRPARDDHLHLRHNGRPKGRHVVPTLPSWRTSSTPTR